jgi:hypothetical protein
MVDIHIELFKIETGTFSCHLFSKKTYSFPVTFFFLQKAGVFFVQLDQI